MTYASLNSWARETKTKLALPLKETRQARYNRVRTLAFAKGLRLYSNGKARLSLAVACAENLTFDEAEQFLKDTNRRARFATVEKAEERGRAILNGTIVPVVVEPKKRIRTPTPSMCPQLVATVEVPNAFHAQIVLPTTSAQPALEVRV